MWNPTDASGGGGSGSTSGVGTLGMGLTAGGGILSAFGSIASGIANRNMYDYQASVARLNAQIAAQNSEFAMQEGLQKNYQFGLQAGQQLGHEKVALASSNLDVRSGSAAQVIKSQENLNRVDEQVIRSNAAKVAYNYKEQATVDTAQAGLYQMAGKNAMTAGFVGAGSSLLASAGSVSNEWLSGQRVGLWGTNNSGTLGA